MVMLYASQRDYDEMAGNVPEDEAVWAAEELAEMHAFMEKFNRDLVESGEFVDAQGLAAPVHTRRFRMKDGAPAVTDGPYPETAEVLAGYTVIECDGFDRASQIAARLARCPGPEAARERAYTELRPIVDGRADLEP
ncbi:YciI family protein [Actinomadura coerulea]|uniref:YciI family protein n=1 Tax=Actinomadura coerulea TaxID=46159 RepID=UPI003431CBB5